MIHLPDLNLFVINERKAGWDMHVPTRPSAMKCGGSPPSAGDPGDIISNRPLRLVDWMADQGWCRRSNARALSTISELL
jgi:hypothetical protein